MSCTESFTGMNNATAVFMNGDAAKNPQFCYRSGGCLMLFDCSSSSQSDTQTLAKNIAASFRWRKAASINRDVWHTC